MVEVQKIENGFLIGDKIAFMNEDKLEGKLTLVKKVGEPVVRGDDVKNLINFPGEYDLEGSFIKAFEYESNLNYLIDMKTKRIALIQNPKIIEVHELDGVDEWIYSDPFTTKLLDKLELEGNRIDLSII